LGLLNEEIALAELKIHETKMDQVGLGAALNFATNALGNAAECWIQLLAPMKQQFQRVLFPNGLIFDGESYRTARNLFGFQLLARIFGREFKFGVPYGKRTRVAAVKEKRFTGTQMRFIPGLLHTRQTAIANSYSHCDCDSRFHSAARNRPITTCPIS
jgi:hypothetical protein